MIAIGLISGTSLDGIDAALVDIVPRGQTYDVRLLRFATYPYEAALHDALRQALPPLPGSLAAAASLHRDVGEAFGRAARAIAGTDSFGFVASHGQTVWHDGERHTTLQLGDAFVIREHAEATVCYDFRSADCAAGGHGAPLVPYFDAMVFHSTAEDCVAVNLGGIANVTLLPRDRGDGIVAFDTGPANMLLDAFVCDRTGGRRSCDEDGALSAAGRVHDDVLDAMLADEYFSAAPPKSTGRERFGSGFLTEHAQRVAPLSLEDGAATLAELTAASLCDAIARAGFAHARIIVSGGGAHNKTLMARIAARLPQARVETPDPVKIPPDAKEAIAFAVLGYETLRGRPANVPSATGASKPVVLGAIAPYQLSALLARIEAECASS